MEYIKPKNTDRRRVEWKVSAQTSAIVKYYAQYTGYSEDEVVDMFLIQLRDDPQFLTWLQKQRRNKRAMEQIYSDTPIKEENIG
ncbi:hypothetical protein NZD89_12000 [Alicyclobacillus fastidiosus]|uniref:Uncharacterized protein n=1 Tax=Alicyclobacillus fastidiosus TaxID=392011 RepID=A0ABY6ZQ12_9BACL|nr:hypothetical protein [Alicyclobacillus fastidiosus]WAH44030.1 hypothetical protein NZD89_12000 [Alicyclobacillus fastidiosus]GMA60318.1 hypothetical protein GCM10025859_07580 [Alicyclobacillus fastidiosus]